VYATGAGSIVTNCDVIANFVKGDYNLLSLNYGGGGVKLDNSASVWNSLILLNSSQNYYTSGGGVHCGAGTLVANCSIISNKVGSSYTVGTAWGGGGVSVADAMTATIRNCLIMGNGRGIYNDGAGISANSGTPVIESCTIVSNFGKGIGSTDAAATTYRVLNTISYFNVGAAMNAGSAGKLYATNSCATSTNGFIGTGNITNNPQFVNFAAGNYKLNKTSLCINTGTNQVWMTGALDLAGTNRLDWRDGLVDMGAYEYVPLRPSGTLMMIR
jgi:hypothetical protein